MAGGSQRLVCIKPILSYNLLQNFLSKFYLRRVKITPKYHIVAIYVALGAIQQSLERQKPPPLGVYGPELLFKSF
jgi:hypothetical protein